MRQAYPLLQRAPTLSTVEARLKVIKNKKVRGVEYKGVTKTVKAWAFEFGINYQTVFGRLRAGWSLEEALQGRA
jgi:hypothetical protein